MNQLLREYRARHWNNVRNVLEPVGCKVYVLTSDSEVFKAVRKTPAESRDCPNTYYRVEDDKEINGVAYWSYL